MTELNGDTPVSSPFSATQLGASPDKAKMVGAQAQIKSVIQEQQNPKEDTLAGAQRLSDYNNAQIIQNAQLAALQTSSGSLGARVKDRVTEIMSVKSKDADYAAVNIPTSDQLVTDLSISTEVATNIQSDLAAYFDEIVQNGVDADTSKSRAALEDTLTAAGLTFEQVNGYIDAINQDTGKKIYDSIKDETVTIADLFGADDEALVDSFEIALGKTRDEFNDWTLADLQKELKKQIRENFSQVDKIRAAMKSVPVGSNRYNAFAKELERLGASGVMTQEEAADRLNAEIDRAGTIDIGDTNYTMEEIFSDTWMNAQMKAYLALPEEKRADSELAEVLPDLVAWIDEHQEIIKPLAGFVTKEDREFDATQAAGGVISAKWTGWDQDGLAKAAGLDKWPEGAMTDADLASLEKLDTSLFSPFLAESLWEDIPETSWVRQLIPSESVFADIKEDLPGTLTDFTLNGIKETIKSMLPAVIVKQDPVLAPLLDEEPTLESVQEASALEKEFGKHAFWGIESFQTYIKNNIAEPGADFEETLQGIRDGTITTEDWNLHQTVKTTEPDQLVSTVFGVGETYETVTGAVNKIRSAAQLGDADAISLYGKISKTLGGKSLTEASLKDILLTSGPAGLSAFGDLDDMAREGLTGLSVVDAAIVNSISQTTGLIEPVYIANTHDANLIYTLGSLDVNKFSDLGLSKTIEQSQAQLLQDMFGGPNVPLETSADQSTYLKALQTKAEELFGTAISLSMKDGQISMQGGLPNTPLGQAFQHFVDQELPIADEDEILEGWDATSKKGEEMLVSAEASKTAKGLWNDATKGNKTETPQSEIIEGWDPGEMALTNNVKAAKELSDDDIKVLQPAKDEQAALLAELFSFGSFFF